jgi:glucose 1-dehydrogenase
MADGTTGAPEAGGRAGGLLTGQRALVTGASSGIGRACAVALAEAGADVAVNYRGAAEKARQVVRDIEGLGRRSMAVQADVADEAEVKRMFAEVTGKFGTLDLLVNNAGMQQDAPLEEMTIEQWNRVIGVNLTGQFLCTREAVSEFKRRGVVPDPREQRGPRRRSHAHQP